MPETQTVTVNAYHPYPAFYWEVKPAGGAWAAIDDGNYSAYKGGQGTEEVTIDAIEGDQAVLRCTIGPLSAGVPVYGQAGTVTTDDIPVTVGALTWDVNPAGENVTIQLTPPSMPVTWFRTDVARVTLDYAEDAIFDVALGSSHESPLEWEIEQTAGNGDWATATTVYPGAITSHGDTRLTIPSVTEVTGQGVRCIADKGTEAETRSTGSLTVGAQPPSWVVTEQDFSRWMADPAIWTMYRKATIYAFNRSNTLIPYGPDVIAYDKNIGARTNAANTNPLSADFTDAGAWTPANAATLHQETQLKGPDGNYTAYRLSGDATTTLTSTVSGADSNYVSIFARTVYGTGTASLITAGNEVTITEEWTRFDTQQQTGGPLIVALDGSLTDILIWGPHIATHTPAYGKQPGPYADSSQVDNTGGVLKLDLIGAGVRPADNTKPLSCRLVITLDKPLQPDYDLFNNIVTFSNSITSSANPTTIHVWSTGLRMEVKTSTGASHTMLVNTNTAATVFDIRCLFTSESAWMQVNGTSGTLDYGGAITYPTNHWRIINFGGGQWSSNAPSRATNTAVTYVWCSADESITIADLQNLPAYIPAGNDKLRLPTTPITNPGVDTFDLTVESNTAGDIIYAAAGPDAFDVIDPVQIREGKDQNDATWSGSIISQVGSNTFNVTDTSPSDVSYGVAQYKEMARDMLFPLEHATPAYSDWSVDANVPWIGDDFCVHAKITMDKAWDDSSYDSLTLLVLAHGTTSTNTFSLWISKISNATLRIRWGATDSEFTMADQGISWAAGETISLKVRVSPTDGLSFWIAGTELDLSGSYLEDKKHLSAPCNIWQVTFDVPDAHPQSMRLVESALTKAEVEAWT